MTAQHYWDEFWSDGLKKRGSGICFRSLLPSTMSKIEGLNKVTFYIFKQKDTKDEAWAFYLKFLEGFLNKDYYSLESPAGLEISGHKISLAVTINAAAMDGNKFLIFSYLNLFRYMLEHNQCLNIFFEREKDSNLSPADLFYSFIKQNQNPSYSVSGIVNPNHALAGEGFDMCQNPVREYEKVKEDLSNSAVYYKAGRFYYLKPDGET
jgi:hypothetical protein